MELEGRLLEGCNCLRNAHPPCAILNSVVSDFLMRDRLGLWKKYVPKIVTNFFPLVGLFLIYKESSFKGNPM